METALLVAAALFLAFANGANDNFKGVATLYGGGTASYPVALAWGTAATAAGGLVSLALAEGLVRSFSGGGVAPDALAGTGAFLAAVGGGAAATVALATRLGFPTSTTHALTGALMGAAFAAGAEAASAGVLWANFFKPLLFGPLLAFAGAAALYPMLSRVRRGLRIASESCVCVGEPAAPSTSLGGEAAAFATLPIVSTGDAASCSARYEGRLLGVSAQVAATAAHYASAAAVSFARGVNDTPKIAALLLGAGLLTGAQSAALVAATMALGGVLGARHVADTMGRRITDMSPGQGLNGNLVTGILVLGASRAGLPVSTTHVSCGSIFGIGATTGTADRRVVGEILLAWLATLPLGAACAAGLYLALTR